MAVTGGGPAHHAALPASRGWPTVQADAALTGPRLDSLARWMPRGYTGVVTDVIFSMVSMQVCAGQPLRCCIRAPVSERLLKRCRGTLIGPAGLSSDFSGYVGLNVGYSRGMPRCKWPCIRCASRGHGCQVCAQTANTPAGLHLRNKNGGNADVVCRPLDVVNT